MGISLTLHSLARSSCWVCISCKVMVCIPEAEAPWLRKEVGAAFVLPLVRGP